MDGLHVAYKKAVHLDPKSTEAILGLGKVYLKQGRLDAAITAIEKAIDIQIDHTEAHYQLAQAYIKRREKAQAAVTMAFFKVLRQTDPLLQEAEIWVKRHPNDPRGYNNLGIVYLARHRSSDAIVNYKRAISLKPDLSHRALQLRARLPQTRRTSARYRSLSSRTRY